MKLYKAAILILLISSCHTYHTSKEIENNFRKRKTEPSYTVIVKHEEATYSLDVTLLKGMILMPKDLKCRLGDTLTPNADMLLVGNFPHDLINPTNFFENPAAFKITGKVIGLKNPMEPIFYVEEWKAIKDVNE